MKKEIVVVLECEERKVPQRRVRQEVYLNSKGKREEGKMVNSSDALVLSLKPDGRHFFFFFFFQKQKPLLLWFLDTSVK